MISIEEKAKCTGCYACAIECPKQCIHMIANTEGFLYPQIEESLCVNCGLCEKVCPIHQKVPVHTDHPTIALAAMNTNESVRMNDMLY